VTEKQKWLVIKLAYARVLQLVETGHTSDHPEIVQLKKLVEKLIDELKTE